MVMALLDSRYIDLYCERTDPSLWSEPLNAASNLAFFVAAFLGWRWAEAVGASGRRAADLFVLAGLAALVGSGSLAFHLLAQVWSAWADVLAILVFIYAYLASALVRVAGLAWRGVALGLVAYAALDWTLGHTLPSKALNGSLQYLPALLSLVALAAVARRRGSAAGPWLAGAAATFLGSLVLRTIDLAACEAWPYGTHFVWHLANGAVLALALRALAAAALGRAPSPATA